MDRIDNSKTEEMRATAHSYGTPTNTTSGIFRADRSDLGALKDGDDVKLLDDTIVRVVCPGENSGWFFGWFFDPNQYGAPQLNQFQASWVVDRAPADPEEAPMPIFPEPSP